MSDAVVAYRYAKALIDFAIEQKVVEDVNNDMKFFTDVCEQNSEFEAVMANPIVRHDKKRTILKNIFESRVNPVTYSIFDVLTRKNRESLIRSIASEFQKLYVKLNNIEQAIVTTVEPLTAAQREEFIKIVKDASGMTVELEERIDKELIGGYVLRVGDTQIDTSVRKKINDLKLELA
ncbi:ATP synthase F1 subunit delta [Arcticibacterium luteifluviistationis]|uniref:ATP synthase subunit delta n=1 Tax=Arcticibacterium luteifluviistationis TaxID=1784714 RepID=A0A2Z4GI57_9BACT|nr:ATP synthase F1 subunit delta [Arcticibacterium luteifluviistationis]AWW00725.1 ATP synthase F1 subunit delta [Arcticibacterium luteifluviistationis]